MILAPIRPALLTLRVLPQVAPELRPALGLPATHAALGLVTCTIDDCLYVALDAGTKAADVDVVYAHSFYAGAAHASGPLSGEAIGLLSGPTPEEVAAGLRATARYLEEKACFYAADDAGRLAFFPHVIPRIGRYLARLAELPEGAALCYLIAPPVEAVLGIDAALKAGRVSLARYFAPPTETNFGGALLTGSESDCAAAAAAFQEAVLEVARAPRRLTASRPAPPAAGGLRYRRHDTGEALAEKPATLTHLFDDRSLVPKTHPILVLRGQLDLLQAEVLEAELVAREEQQADVVRDLGAVLAYLRGLMACEVAGRPCPTLVLGGLDADELHRVSHHTAEYLGVPFLLPDAAHGRLAVRCNLLRARSRELELLALPALAAADHVPTPVREQILHGLNRLSNALYVLTCKVVARRGTP